LFSIATTTHLSPWTWHCQSKENKVVTTKVKHDLGNGEVLPTILQKPLLTLPLAWHCQSKENKMTTTKVKHEFKNGKVFGRSSKTGRLGGYPGIAGGNQRAKEEQEEA
jgi:hypothetical protein